MAMTTTPSTPTVAIARELRRLGLKQGKGGDFTVAGHYRNGERLFTYVTVFSMDGERLVAEHADEIEERTANGPFPFKVSVRYVGNVPFTDIHNGPADRIREQPAEAAEQAPAATEATDTPAPAEPAADFRAGDLVTVDGRPGHWELMEPAAPGTWTIEPARAGDRDRQEAATADLHPLADAPHVRRGDLTMQHHAEQEHAGRVGNVYRLGRWVCEKTFTEPDSQTWTLLEDVDTQTVVTPEQVSSAVRLPVEHGQHRGRITQAVVSSKAGKFRVMCQCHPNGDLARAGRQTAWCDTLEEARALWTWHCTGQDSAVPAAKEAPAEPAPAEQVPAPALDWRDERAAKALGWSTKHAAAVRAAVAGCLVRDADGTPRLVARPGLGGTPVAARRLVPLEAAGYLVHGDADSRGRRPILATADARRALALWDHFQPTPAVRGPKQEHLPLAPLQGGREHQRRAAEFRAEQAQREVERERFYAELAERHAVEELEDRCWDAWAKVQDITHRLGRKVPAGWAPTDEEAQEHLLDPEVVALLRRRAAEHAAEQAPVEAEAPAAADGPQQAAQGAEAGELWNGRPGPTPGPGVVEPGMHVEYLPGFRPGARTRHCHGGVIVSVGTTCVRWRPYAWHQDVRTPLDHMRIDPTMHVNQREWVRRMAAELDAGRPLPRHPEWTVWSLAQHLAHAAEQAAVAAALEEAPARVVVIPCGGAKLDHPAPAGELYVGGFHRACRRAADALTAEGGTVVVLSALHGLVPLDQVLEPYELRMGQPGSVTPARLAEQARALCLDGAREVVALGGAAYTGAALAVWPHAATPLAGLGGMGYQLRALAAIAAGRASAAPAGGAPAGGPAGTRHELQLDIAMSGCFHGDHREDTSPPGTTHREDAHHGPHRYRPHDGPVHRPHRHGDERHGGDGHARGHDRRAGARLGLGGRADGGHRPRGGLGGARPHRRPARGDPPPRPQGHRRPRGVVRPAGRGLHRRWRDGRPGPHTGTVPGAQRAPLRGGRAARRTGRGTGPRPVQRPPGHLPLGLLLRRAVPGPQPDPGRRSLNLPPHAGRHTRPACNLTLQYGVAIMVNARTGKEPDHSPQERPMTAPAATSTTTPYAYRQCAARARDLAEILRTRLEGHPHRAELLVFIGHLHTAAEGFETAEPLIMDGIAVTNVTPAEGHLPLLMAMGHAADHPEAGISQAVFAYVTAPVTRRTFTVEPLPGGGRQDAELRTGIALAEHDLATEGHPTTRYALLALLVQLHGDHLARGGQVTA